MREIGVEGLQADYGPFSATDIIRLLPTEAELEEQIIRMNTNRQRSKSDKKASKKRKIGEAGAFPLESLPSVISHKNECDGGNADGHPSEGLPLTHSTAIASSLDIVSTQSADDKNSRSLTDSQPQKSKKPNLQAERKNTAKAPVMEEATGKLSVASSLCKDAEASIAKREAESNVFKSMFHKGGTSDKHDRDLFMSVAGIRYTIS